MKTLPAPIESPVDVFLACIDIVRDPNLKARLFDCRNLILDAAAEFDLKASNNTTHQIVAEQIVNGNVTAAELSDVYTLRMATKNTPGRALYDRLKASSPYDICPMCGHRIVTNLDHYLPKARYPRLSVVPVNLVPCCSDCNKTKLHSVASNSDEETLHPYYDNIDNVMWLQSEVLHTTPPSILYTVNPHHSWNAVLVRRVENHFEAFGIGQLYANQAAVELSTINYRLEKLFAAGGSDMVRAHLEECAESAIYANKNSWQSALYSALHRDDWFCDAGFKY